MILSEGRWRSTDICQTNLAGAMLAQCHVDTIAFTECFLLPRKSKQAVGSVGKVCMTQDRPGEGNSRDFYKPRGNM